MAMSTDASPLMGDSSHYIKRQVGAVPCWRNKTVWMLTIAIILAAIAVVSWILHFILKEVDPNNKPILPHTRNQYFEQQFLQLPSNTSCYKLSHLLASQPHTAIDQRTYELATILAQMFTDLGYNAIRDNISNMVFDHYISSSLSLQLPNSTHISLDLSNGFIPGDQDTNVSLQYNAWQAFSASGSVSAPLLYVGNATDENLDYLQHNLSLDLTKYIAFVTNGDRASRTKRIGLRGMKAIIQFESNYNEPDTVYPHGSKRPNTGYMYGRIRESSGCPGGIDPDRLYHQCGYNLSEYHNLFPSIKYNVPNIIISSANAIQIFQLFSTLNHNTTNDALCDILPNEWHPGNLPVNKICVGGNIVANVTTDNDIHFNDSIQNVYGYFEGDTYPEEIVMIGAHRDAWALGASDDISGTVTMMEIARTLSVLRDEYKWSSRRSLMFASWDGEEWGLYGSVDFNENAKHKAQYVDKIVAYINFDMTVTGYNMVFLSNPLFSSLLFESSKQLNYPYSDHGFSDDMSLYQVWKELNPSDDIRLVSTGSDYGAFEYYSGIPSIGVRFDTYPESFPDVYHTFYDVNGVLDIMDPEWKYAQQIAALGGLLMLKIAQAQILPWDVTSFADKMSEWMDVDLVNKAENTANCSIDAYIPILEEAVDKFSTASILFDKEVKKYRKANKYDGDRMDPKEVIKFNNVLKELMKLLTLKYPQGLPSNKWYKHVIIDPGLKRFPYIWDRIIFECDATKLQQAFVITSSMVYNASQLLQSILD